MRKLSRSLNELKPQYDVVVIGSGYGGSISASRFSRAGLNVCLLEKGKEFQPGDYPATLAAATEEMQLNGDTRTAKKNGLYNFHIGKDITVFKGCGLGGTSLVNANVAIKPEPRVFDDARWPSAIRNNMQSMDEAYLLARKVLNPKPYPANTPGYPELAKAKAHETSAKAMNQPFYYTDINVTFEDGPNSVGYEQKKCNNCGDCVTGCNHSAKNTLIMNYLPDAANNSAEIFCNIDVSYVERSGDKWLVYFDVFGAERDKFNAPLMFVRADMVIVAGGALGSTELLLRSKEKGLSVSPMLGRHFTGNGDVLGFAYNTDGPINGIGKGIHYDDPKLAPVGPCITSIIDMRKQPTLTDGLTFEEGSIPGPLAAAINSAMLGVAGVSPDTNTGGFRHTLKDKEQELISLVEGPYHGATNRMQTYLIMSHDDGNGEMSLKDGNLDISWPGVGKQPIFDKANQAMYDATKALGGIYVKDFVWNKMLDYEVISVHPLGGCCMGEDAATGVTDHTGNVFSGNGSETHPGLHVLDGSILPLPLGTNPLYTISAVSERACQLIAEGMGRQINHEMKPMQLPDVHVVPAVQFTETMKGYVSFKEKQDFEKGYEAGRQEVSPCLFTLTIKTEDIDLFLTDPGHTGSIAGTVVAPLLSDRPLMVSNGVFNLFEKDTDNPKHLKMKYNMQLHSYDGKQYYFNGFKKIEDNKIHEIWHDTTVLYTTIYEGTDTSGAVLAMGILKIAPTDLAIQMTTMKPMDCANLHEGINALKKFSTFFSDVIIDNYFKKLW